MLGTARAIEAGMIYHVLNRGNARRGLLHKDADFDAFERACWASRWSASRWTF